MDIGLQGSHLFDGDKIEHTGFHIGHHQVFFIFGQRNIRCRLVAVFDQRDIAFGTDAEHFAIFPIAHVHAAVGVVHNTISAAKTFGKVGERASFLVKAV